MAEHAWLGDLAFAGISPPLRQTYVNVLAELDPELLEALLLKFV